MAIEYFTFCELHLAALHAHSLSSFQYGKLWTGHQRQPVFLNDRQDGLAWQKARRVRSGHLRVQCRSEDWGTALMSQYLRLVDLTH